MAMDLVTREDLQRFREQLLEDFKLLLGEVSLSRQGLEKKWLRSREVRKLLNISPNTLQQLRISGKLPYTRMGSIHYYSATVIQEILEEGTKS